MMQQQLGSSYEAGGAGGPPRTRGAGGGTWERSASIKDQTLREFDDRIETG